MDQELEEDSICGHIVKFHKENHRSSSDKEEPYVYCVYMVTKEKHLPNRWVMIDLSIMEPNKTQYHYSKDYKLILTEELFDELLEQGKVSLSKYDSEILELISK